MHNPDSIISYDPNMGKCGRYRMAGMPFITKIIINLYVTQTILLLKHKLQNYFESKTRKSCNISLKDIVLSDGNFKIKSKDIKEIYRITNIK